MTERRTRLVVDIVWNGPDSGDRAREEHYYEDSELGRVAADWITDAFEDRDDSPRVTVEVIGVPSEDRGRHAGEALASVRTVLSRAETALEELGPEGSALEWPPRPRGREGWAGFTRREAARFEDPDAPAMRQALRAVVALLGPWRRTGRPTRSTCL